MSDKFNTNDEQGQKSSLKTNDDVQIKYYSRTATILRYKLAAIDCFFLYNKIPVYRT